MNETRAEHEEWGTVTVLEYDQGGRSAIVEARYGQRILLPTSELRRRPIPEPRSLEAAQDSEAEEGKG